MEREAVYIIIILNIVISVLFYIKTKCEIPFFLALFNLFVEYRLISIIKGYTTWVDIEYGIYFVFNLENASIVSELILLGSTIIIYSFILIYREPVRAKIDSNDLLSIFIKSKKRIIISGLFVFTIIQIILSNKLSLGYESLTKLANISFVLMFFWLAIFSKDNSIISKAIFIIIFVCLGFITYEDELRFQFLGWIIPIAYYFGRNINPIPKVLLIFLGLFLILILFSAARVMRYKDKPKVTFTELYNDSLYRIKVADDVNFIDGFMMVHQIYPKHLEHTYGKEHLNIILRPIPRTIWPSKPLAGWLQNYYAKHGKKGLWSAGFSPTLYGVFYSEMGKLGIIFFSVLWAFLLSYFYKLTQLYNSDLKVFLVGIMLASMIPVFRSGDLPGDFAIVLMSYWPIIIFVTLYNKFIKQMGAYEE